MAQSCPSLSDPTDCSLPGSSIHGILKAGILEWVAIVFSRRSSQPRDRTHVSCIGRWVLLPLHHLGSPIYISCMRVCMHAKSFQSCMTLYDPMGCSCQAPLSRDFPGKNTGVGCHFFLQWDLPDPGIKPWSLVSPALAGGFFTTEPPAYC